MSLIQLESVLGKIKTASTKQQDQLVTRLEPLELPTPVSKKGRLQPLTSNTTETHKDDEMLDKLLRKSNDNDRPKPSMAVDANFITKTDKDSTSHIGGLNEPMNTQRTSTSKLLTKQDDPQVGYDADKATTKSDSLQLSTASIPSEISEGDEDLENLTEEGILEKLIALPSNSDNENDLNKVSEDVLKQKKQEMDTEFEQHQLKPGDEDYEYDKEIDFDGDDKVSCGWDSSDSNIEYF